MKFGTRIRLKPSNDRGEFELDRARNKNNIAENLFALGHETHNTAQECHKLEDLLATLHEKLQWNSHVDDVLKKAINISLSHAFIRRNVINCPPDVKTQCYKTLVRPNLEYASPVWDPYTATNIAQIEAVHFASCTSVNYRFFL